MAELDTIDIEPKYLEMVKSIFARYLPYKKVWAYGSRVKWTAGHASDLDCVIFNATDSGIHNTQEAFDESDIPFEVQLLNWENIPDDFKDNIKEQYFVLRNKGDWKETTLGEIITLHYGKSLPVTKRIDGNIPVYSSAGLTGWHNKPLVESEALIIRRKGTIGKVYKTTIPFFAIDTSYYILPDEDKYNFNYLFYMLLELRLNELNEDSAVLGLNRATAYSCKITLPTFPEQKAIAAVLSSLDDKIDLFHRQNKTLESIAETIFRQWFIEEADDSWEERKLGVFIKLKKGKNITKSQAINGQYPVIAGGLAPFCYHNQCNTGTPVITISASGANAGFVNLHYSPVWSSDSSFIDDTTTNYVYFFYVLLKYYQEDIYDQQEGSAQPHIYPSHLMDLDILKYNLILIENYEINVTPLFKKIAKNQRQIKTLESFRNTLLPKLMSGNIRVEYKETL